MGVKMRWFGKDSLFRPPLGPILSALGGIPVDRSKQNDLVAYAASVLADPEQGKRFALMVPVEGTRKAAPFWKSGFIHIAKKADVPVALGFLDFERKLGGVLDIVKPTDDHKAFMDIARELYKDIQGKYPEDFGPVRLREEVPEEES